MKLFKCYSTDECTNEQKLEESLNKLKKEGKIEYDTLDRWTIKVTDIDLDIDEEKYLIDLFDKLEVYPLKDDDDLDEADYGDYDNDGSDYHQSSGRQSSYNDENEY